MAKELKLVEVCASYSRKINMGNFESRDVFCSHKEECKPSEAEATYRRIFHFCKTMADLEAEQIIEAHKEPVIDVNEDAYPAKPIGQSTPKSQGKLGRPFSERQQETRQEEIVRHTPPDRPGSSFEETEE
jgi:hypothetical protein